MSPDVILIANSVIATLGVTALTFAVLWLRARERYIRAELRQPREERASPGDAPIDRLQQTVDAMAVELERVGEALRFTTRLLAERGERGEVLERPRIPERVITPH